MKTIQGLIKRRMLINFQIEPNIAQNILPHPFSPKVIKGKSIIGVCLIKLEEMRPSFLEKCPTLGIASENAAHRIAVEWDENGITREGVYIFRRDTNSRLITLTGGRIFNGEHYYSTFDIEDHNKEIEYNMQSSDGKVHIQLNGKETEVLPDSSVFTSLEEISDFFEAGSDGYSPAQDHSCHQGICLQTIDWEAKPLQVNDFSTTFFNHQFQIQNEHLVFDSGLMMRDIQHTWTQIPSVG